MPLKRRTQKMFDSVTERIKNQTQGGLKVNPETGVRYEEPLEEKHPGLTVGVMAAQPGTILEKILAPMVYKGMAQSISEGNLSEALMASVAPVKIKGTGLITDLDKIGKSAKITLSDPDKYWYVAHQTGSVNFPNIMKSGLQTTNGLNGTALHLTQDYVDDFANGLLKQKHLSHEGADGLVIMKFPKSEFPSSNLDDISIKLMDMGKSKNFEVPPEYLSFLKKTQFKHGGKLKHK